MTDEEGGPSGYPLSDAETTLPPGAVEVERPHAMAEQNNPRNKEPTAHEKRMYRVQKWGLIVLILYAGFTAYAAWKTGVAADAARKSADAAIGAVKGGNEAARVAERALKENQRANRLTRESNELTQKSVALAERSMIETSKAALGFKALLSSVPLARGRPYYFGVVLRNYGKSVALNVHSWYGPRLAVWGREAEATGAVITALPSSSLIIGPGEEQSISFEPLVVPPEVFDQIMRYERQLSVWVVAQYTDQFSSTHMSSACFWFLPDIQGWRACNEGAFIVTVPPSVNLR